MIEWPEKAGARLPPADLELTLDYAPIGRRAAARARTDCRGGMAEEPPDRH